MDAETFITKWGGGKGGAERANYQMFLSELCQAIGVASPDPASQDTCSNDYVFERAVKPRESEGSTAPKRIDLYKRGAFILEAKQSPERLRQAEQSSLSASPPPQDAPSSGKWDVLMRNARRQAEDYVFRLDPDLTNPFAFGVGTSPPPTRVRVFDIAAAVPAQDAAIEFVVQNAGSTCA